MNKLRMTGFECFAIFVIRRAKHAPKGAARHWRQERCLGIEKKLMSLPIEHVRLTHFFFITKIEYWNENSKHNNKKRAPIFGTLFMITM